MLPIVLAGLLGSTVPVSIIGTRFALGVKPFWTPEHYGECGSVIPEVLRGGANDGAMR